MQRTHTIDVGEGCAVHVYSPAATLLAAAEAAAREAIGQCEKRPLMKMFGKPTESPRDYCLLAPTADGEGYKFSGGVAKQVAMGDAGTKFFGAFLEASREQDPGFQANRMLANYYPYLDSSIGYHKDKESSLRINKSGVWGMTIYTEEKGEDRRMFFKSDATKVRTTIRLRHGEVFVMHGHNFQKKFKHSIPKIGKNKTPRVRVSFTFRMHKL